jgi:hypothetical protein
MKNGNEQEKWKVSDSVRRLAAFAAFALTKALAF